MVFLPVLFFFLVWRFFILKGLEWREAFLAAFTVWGVLTVVAVETLTFVFGLKYISLVAFWIVLSSIFGFLVLRCPRAGAFRWGWPTLTWPEWMMLSGSVLILGVTLFIALFSPPNTWDSMSYHMSRVSQWMSHNGVMNYPTNTIRQLVYLPYAEYAILHAQILSGGDRFANIIQWGAFAGCAVGVSLISRELGAARLWQVASALSVLTLPMGILQASSTQSDLVAGLWCVVMAVGTLLFIRSGRRRWILMIAGSVALAVLTKAAGLVIGFFFVGAALCLARGTWVRRLQLLGVVALMLVCLTTPFMLRLIAVDANPSLALAQGGRVTMTHVTMAAIVSNGLRNAATELALPIKSWNTQLVAWITACHRPLGLDVADQATSSVKKFAITYALDEDYMPNPWHMMVIIIAGGVFFFVRGKDRAWWGYYAVLISATLVFLGTVLWQPWIGRFHMPFFMLALPLAFVVLAKVLPRFVLLIVTGLLFLGALHPLIENNTRRLVSAKSMFHFTREQRYFMKHPWEYGTVDQITKLLKKAGCTDLGLKLTSDDWDYPWMLFMGRESRVEHVNVTERAGSFLRPGGDFYPCAVVAHKALIPENQQFDGRVFVQVAQAGESVLFLDPLWAKTQGVRNGERP
jgi:hypothetical protein